MRSTLGYIHKSLVLGIGNFTSSFNISYSLQLPLVQVKSCQNLLRQPVPPHCYNEMGTALLEVGLRESRFPAIVTSGTSYSPRVKRKID